MAHFVGNLQEFVPNIIRTAYRWSFYSTASSSFILDHHSNYRVSIMMHLSATSWQNSNALLRLNGSAVRQSYNSEDIKYFIQRHTDSKLIMSLLQKCVNYLKCTHTTWCTTAASTSR